MGRLHAVRLLPVLVIAGVMLLGGAHHYTVYRGTTPGTITTAVTPAGGVTGTSFIDPAATNGTAYYYVVRAVNTGTDSTNSATVQATPVVRSCSSGNVVVVE